MIRRQVIGAGLILGILGGILIDTWFQAHPTKIVYAQEPEPPQVVQIEVVIDWTLERIQKEIDTVAAEYSVSADVIRTVIHCESRYNRFAVGDGGHSRGLVQIHSRYHPSVSDDQAFDPAFALRFLAEKLRNGQGALWTCYRMNY